MPINGLIASWDILEIGWNCSSGDASGTVSSLWTPDAIDVAASVVITVGDVTGYATQTYNVIYPTGPPEGFGGSAAAPIDVRVDFLNWKLYGVNPDGENYLFHVFWSGINIIVNGVTVASGVGGDMVSSALGPSWVPIFCGLVNLSGAGNATIGGGWHYQIAGEWYAPPIALPPITANPPTTYYEPGYGPAPFDLTFEEVIISSSTWGSQITTYGYANYTYYPDGVVETMDTQGASGSVVLIPNMPKAINRLNPDFQATFFAYAVPQVWGWGQRLWVVDGADPVPPPGTGGEDLVTTATAIVVNRVAEGSQEVGNTPGTIEGFFSLPTYAPVSTQSSKSHLYNSDGEGGILNQIEDLQFTYPYALDEYPPYLVAPYMQHANPLCDYFNSAVCHPHWSIGYYTGPWNLYGGTEVWGGSTGYWGWIREQFMSGQGRRNHIVSCPLESGGWNAFLNSFFQCPESPDESGMRWIGVSRWQTENFTPPSSLTLNANSAGAWTVTSSSCTLSFGTSGITVTPNASPCIFVLNLSQTLYEPFLYGAICTQIGLNWPGSGISSVQAYALSEDGVTSALLAASEATTTVPGTYPFPDIPDQKYAGSWGIDNGLGVATDTGIDEAPYGMSPTVMGSVTTQEAFGFMMIGQPVAIQFAVVPTSSGEGYSTFVIDYPTLYAATAKILVNESGQISTYLYKDGPGVRLGNHEFYPGSWANPPVPNGLGYKGTVIDGLADLRLLAGVDPLTGLIAGQSLTTQCTTLYDSFEGNSVGQVDDDSNYFLLPPNPTSPTETTMRMALVNSWSEVPPLAGYPNWGRDNNWNPTTGLVQQTWALCQLPRNIMSPGHRADLLNPSNVLETTSSPHWIDGWTVTQFSPVINNTESVNWQIVTGYGRSSQKLWAYVTPWHGYYANLLVRKPCLGPQRR